MSYVQSISQDAGGSGTGTGLAFTSNNTAGNTLFFAVRCGADCTVTVSDTRSNAGWHEDVHSSVQTDDGSIISLWSCPNCAAGANTVNFTFSTAVTARYAIVEYNGLLTSGILDVSEGTKQSGGASTTTPVSNSATPTTGKSLVIGVLATGGAGGSVTAGTGYTLREAANASNRLAFEDKEITVTTAQTAGFTLSVADTYIAVIAVYKEASAGGGTLTAAQGSYTLTGQTAGQLKGSLVSAAQGSYTLLGSPGLIDVTSVAAQGSYALTGEDAALRGPSVLSAAQGSYALTGQTAGLLRTIISAAAQGLYTLSGQIAVLRYSGAPSVSAYPLWIPLILAKHLPWLRNYTGLTAAAISEADGVHAWAKRGVITHVIYIDVHSVPGYPRPGYP